MSILKFQELHPSQLLVLFPKMGRESIARVGASSTYDYFNFVEYKSTSAGIADERTSYMYNYLPV